MIVRKEKKKKRAKPYLLGFLSNPVSLLFKKVKQKCYRLPKLPIKIANFSSWWNVQPCLLRGCE